jgi:hypothetical protein
VADHGRERRQRLSFVLAWVAAAVVAVTVGVGAVTGLGDQILDRGPIGDNELVRKQAAENTRPAELDPEEPVIEETFTDEFGEFVVACQGKFAIGVDARPDEAAGWRLISYEPGPDDDIDAVFSNGERSQELEVFCNLGRPVLSELENHTLPEPED